MKKLKIWIVEDEEIVRESIKDELVDAGYSVRVFNNPKSCFQVLSENLCDILITDIRLPEYSGIKLLGKVKTSFPKIFVIIMTAYGSVDSAVDAMKKGAYDYITKPFEKEELLLLIDRVKKMIGLHKTNIKFQRHFTERYNFDSFVGESAYTKELINTIKMVAASNSTALITGETGTGKEMVANLIHYGSQRKNNPLIKVSCAILSRDVIESELFGHEKGAYTGAEKQRIGRFEAADSGAIYLDDIDDVPLDVQVKMLRVLQEQEIERVGSNETIKIDVRVIASTKANLLNLAKTGKFRIDLYFRLNIIPIHLKPLREHTEDIVPLFKHFLKNFGQEKNFEVSPEVYEILCHYAWPGNVREVRNLAERLVMLSDINKITVENLPKEIFDVQVSDDENLCDKPLNEALEIMEVKLIKCALWKSGNNKAKAAEILGIPASTLKSKIEKFMIG
jgi:DNA-binding NtrC family response regulator